MRVILELDSLDSAETREIQGVLKARTFFEALGQLDRCFNGEDHIHVDQFNEVLQELGITLDEFEKK